MHRKAQQAIVGLVFMMIVLVIFIFLLLNERPDEHPIYDLRARHAMQQQFVGILYQPTVCAPLSDMMISCVEQSNLCPGSSSCEIVQTKIASIMQNYEKSRVSIDNILLYEKNCPIPSLTKEEVQFILDGTTAHIVNLVICE